jgi:hypothetical protein
MMPPGERAVKRLRVLLVEDEILVAMDLENTITEIALAEVIIKPSVRSAEEIVNEPFDFAFLDINVTNGETFGIARTLLKKGVPFAFVSAAPPLGVPRECRSRPIFKSHFRDRNSKKRYWPSG